MYDLGNTKHHPAIQELVDLLKSRTQNQDEQFFLAEVAYYLGKIASTQRTIIKTKDRGDIPVNIYSIALATSGFGKNFSVNIMEGIIADFKDTFVMETMPKLAASNIRDLADTIAAKRNTDPEMENESLTNSYDRQGEYLFTFDSGTVPALKQLRNKILLANCGSVNFQVDELGSNLMNSAEILNAYLELYDKGHINTKLVKNTAENIRDLDVRGFTPANMLLFGTPSKLFDGGQTENMFNQFLDTGYARRCLFGLASPNEDEGEQITAEELFKQLTSTIVSNTEQKWRDIFAELADVTYSNWEVTLPDSMAIELIRYRQYCDTAAARLPDHREIEKAELSHRYFKALKLAGALAFIDKEFEITDSHLRQAILVVETLAESFRKVMTREPAYARLARYIADVDLEVTHADLHEALPFYSTSRGAREEIMSMATAWGYKQHILIKKNYIEGIEFFSGEALKKTDLNELILSYSTDWAENFVNERVPFKELHTLCTQDQYRWVNHHLEGGKRKTENAISGCNLLVLDVDGTASLSLVQELLKEFTYFIHTTKRHTEEENRFRVVLPVNYEVKLDADDYREFIDNVRKWLPFEVDHCSNQIVKAWTTYEDCDYFYNEGEQLIEALKFIPKTRRNEEFTKEHSKVENFDALERWFAQKLIKGNRNNNMLKFALALVDSGLDLPEVRSRVLTFNKRIESPLEVGEIESTVLKTVASKYGKRTI